MLLRKYLFAGAAAAGMCALASQASAMSASVLIGSSTTANLPYEVKIFNGSTPSTYSLASEVGLPIATVAGTGYGTDGVAIEPSPTATDYVETDVTTNKPLEAGTYYLTVFYTGATPSSSTSTGSPALGILDGANVDKGNVIFNSAATGSYGSQNYVQYMFTVTANNTGNTTFQIAPSISVTGSVTVTAELTIGNNAPPAGPGGEVTDYEPPVTVANVITTGASGYAISLYPTHNPQKILKSGGIFNTLDDGTFANAGPGIGELIVKFTPGVYSDLADHPVQATDISSISLDTKGTFTLTQLTPGDPTDYTFTHSSSTTPGEEVDTITSDYFNPTAPSFLAPTGPLVIPVDLELISPSNTTPVPPSTYTATASINLDSEFSATPASDTNLDGSGDFSALNIYNGFSYLVPWVSSASQAAMSGNTNTIRISDVNVKANTSLANNTADIFAVIYNPTNGIATSTPVSQYVCSVSGMQQGSASNSTSECAISSATLQNLFGNFGRADFRIIIAGEDGNGSTANLPVMSGFTVKRLLSNVSGGITDFSVTPEPAAVPHFYYTGSSTSGTPN